MPVRALTMCGALVIDSMPPATTTAAEPALIRSWPSMIDFMPEPHTLLMVVQPTAGGRPAPSEAWRAGAWPRLAVSTQPMITSLTSVGATPDCSSAARIAVAPRVGVGTPVNWPRKEPMAVRLAPAMTTSDMGFLREAWGAPCAPWTIAHYRSPCRSAANHIATRPRARFACAPLWETGCGMQANVPCDAGACRVRLGEIEDEYEGIAPPGSGAGTGCRARTGRLRGRRRQRPSDPRAGAGAAPDHADRSGPRDRPAAAGCTAGADPYVCRPHRGLYRRGRDHRHRRQRDHARPSQPGGAGDRRADLRGQPDQRHHRRRRGR